MRALFVSLLAIAVIAVAQAEDQNTRDNKLIAGLALRAFKIHHPEKPQNLQVTYITHARIKERLGGNRYDLEFIANRSEDILGAEWDCSARVFETLARHVSYTVENVSCIFKIPFPDRV